MKFEKHDDLFSFNRSLMEDDYNDGQQLVVKDKRKAGDHEFNTSVKVGEAKNGASKLVIEEKIKSKFAEIGGMRQECKVKNDGTLSCENQFDGLKQYAGFESLSVFLASKATRTAGMKPLDVGFEYDSSEVKAKTTLSTEKNPNFHFSGAYRVCPTATIAAILTGKAFDITKNDDFGVAWASGFPETGVQWGASFKSSLLNRVMTAYKCDFYFNHETADKTVGAHFNYDNDKKEWASKLGLKIMNADHVWKARLHNTGLMRLALQWQLHKTAKVTANSSLNLKDLPAGSISNIPLNFTVELKY